MNPRVNIGVLGRFHAFDLAYQLQRNGYLNKLQTSYPKFKTMEWGVPRTKLISHPSLEVLKRLNMRARSFSIADLQAGINSIHATLCAKELEGCDVFIGWSGSSLEAIKRAKALGKISILERGSTHYSFQAEVLQKECERLNIKTPRVNKKVWYRELEEYELCDYISVPTDFVKNTFTDKGIAPSKILVNPYGVNLDKFAKKAKLDDTFRVVFVGQASIRKGFHLLLDAFSQLDLPNSELLHVGLMTQEIQRFFSGLNQSKITFAGHVPQNKLIDLYAQGSVFVMPSLEEGLAMVQIQAMACGLPLLCTENSGGGMIIEHGREGLIMDAGSVDSIKQALIMLYENPENLSVMGAAAEEKVKSGYTWNDYGNRYVNNINLISKTT